MQQAWLDYDVAQCGYCQPGQIMAAVALVKQVHAEGRQITDADLDQIRNICRCGTYFRIREAIMAGAKKMGRPTATSPSTTSPRSARRRCPSPRTGERHARRTSVYPSRLEKMAAEFNKMAYLLERLAEGVAAHDRENP